LIRKNEHLSKKNENHARGYGLSLREEIYTEERPETNECKLDLMNDTYSKMQNKNANWGHDLRK